MANHMAEVAKMLGVELGEEFNIDYATDITTLSAKVTDTGFHIINSNSPEFSGLFLNLLLSGQLEIKRSPWKPKRGETYWYVEKDGDIWEREWHSCRYMSDHVNRYKLGNCYRTCEEAEANRDKWIKFYASDEVLEV